MKYEKIYAFQVLDKIKGGKTVYMLDRQQFYVCIVNDIRVCILMDVLNTKDTTNRYEFWIEEVTEDAEL
jgi:sortase (surface protein transpeptidase)